MKQARAGERGAGKPPQDGRRVSAHSRRLRRSKGRGCRKNNAVSLVLEVAVASGHEHHAVPGRQRTAGMAASRVSHGTSAGLPTGCPHIQASNSVQQPTALSVAASLPVHPRPSKLPGQDPRNGPSPEQSSLVAAVDGVLVAQAAARVHNGAHTRLTRGGHRGRGGEVRQQADELIVGSSNSKLATQLAHATCKPNRGCRPGTKPAKVFCLFPAWQPHTQKR